MILNTFPYTSIMMHLQQTALESFLVKGKCVNNKQFLNFCHNVFNAIIKYLCILLLQRFFIFLPDAFRHLLQICCIYKKRIYKVRLLTIYVKWEEIKTGFNTEFKTFREKGKFSIFFNVLEILCCIRIQNSFA